MSNYQSSSDMKILLILLKLAPGYGKKNDIKVSLEMNNGGDSRFIGSMPEQRD